MDTLVDCRLRGAGKTHDLAREIARCLVDGHPVLVFCQTEDACRWVREELGRGKYLIDWRRLTFASQHLPERFYGVKRETVIFADNVDLFEEGIYTFGNFADRVHTVTCRPNHEHTLDWLGQLDRKAEHDRESRSAREDAWDLRPNQ